MCKNRLALEVVIIAANRDFIFDHCHFFLISRTRRLLPDPKRINRALFGAWYEEDIYDKFCAAVPAAMRAFRWRIPAAMRARKLIFVHVPRVAGTSIMCALYGEGCIHHHSMRYYRALDPGFAQSAQSFALLRDPLDRFASAYAFVRAGGTAYSRLSDVSSWRQTAGHRIGPWMTYLGLSWKGRGPLELDFVMRPQSWFVCDCASGAPLVKDLFVLGEDDQRLPGRLSGAPEDRTLALAQPQRPRTAMLAITYGPPAPPHRAALCR